jgi:Pyruvate/2-oxoacid:ferredoxin oxidoreductase delta subunit
MTRVETKTAKRPERRINRLINADRPERRMAGGGPWVSGAEGRALGGDETTEQVWIRQYPEQARRYNWIQNEILDPQRSMDPGPVQYEAGDVDELTRQIKEYTLELGADDVGIADYDPSFTFADREVLPHSRVIAFALGMKYDLMADIGPASQEEVHRVYFKMLDIGVRLAQYIASFGYSATAHPNGGELAHIPYAYLAGLGELGKHGSLISPKLGSSLRLALVSTDMPLTVDGPQDFGIDDICSHCNVCTRYCPADAIKPDKETVAGVTRWYVDTPACFPVFQQLWGCKICLAVCPFNGRSATNKDSYKDIAKVLAKEKAKEGLLRYLAHNTPQAKANPILVHFLDEDDDVETQKQRLQAGEPNA